MNKLRNTTLACALLFAAPLAAHTNVQLDLVHQEKVGEQIIKHNVIQHISAENGMETTVYAKEDGLNIAITVFALDTEEDVDAAVNPNGTEIGLICELGKQAFIKVTISDGTKIISQPALLVTWGEEAWVAVGEEDSEGNAAYLELALVVTR